MILALGIIIGILLFALLIGIDLIFRKKVNSQGILAQLERTAIMKGSIIEPKDEEVENFINDLPKE